MQHIPLSWLRLQGHNAPINLFGATQVYEAFARGGDPLRTAYAQALPPGAREARIEELFNLCSCPFALDEPLPVILTARGGYELLDGHHRAARALCEGWDSIPVEVQQVAPSWQRLVKDLGTIYPGRPKHLYQEIEHPYFDDWTLDRKRGRLPMVMAAIDALGVTPEDGVYMEFGSCTGRFTREFSRRGWITYSSEIDPVVASVSEYLLNVFGLHSTWYAREDPYIWLGEWCQVPIGVILTLSVFHRYISPAYGRHEWVQKIYRRAIAQSKVFIVDCGSPGDTSLQPSPIPLDPAGFTAWLQSLAGAKTVRPLGDTEGRIIYAIA